MYLARYYSILSLFIIPMLCIVTVNIPVKGSPPPTIPPVPVYKGVWINAFGYGAATPQQQAATANDFGGKDSILDLVVIGAEANNKTIAMYPSTITNDTQTTDKAEPFITEFENAGYKCILDMQSQGTNITLLINEILTRYQHHKNIVGIAVDSEWKHTGAVGQVTSAEADSYISTIKSFNSTYRLFVTNYVESKLPSDRPGLTILYDGISTNETTLLNIYHTWGQKWSSLGMYVFDKHAKIPDNLILNAAHNTSFIMHEEYSVLNPIELSINSSDIVFNPVNPVQGKPLNISVTVHNIGLRNATNVTVALYDGNPMAGGLLINQGNVSKILSGLNESITLKMNTTGKAGWHTIYASVDPDRMIYEVNKSNNVATRTLYISGGSIPEFTDLFILILSTFIAAVSVKRKIINNN